VCSRPPSGALAPARNAITVPRTKSPPSRGTSRHDIPTRASAAVYQVPGAPVNRALRGSPGLLGPLTLQAYTGGCGYCAKYPIPPQSQAIRPQNPVERRPDTNATGAPLGPLSAYSLTIACLSGAPPAPIRPRPLVHHAHSAFRKAAIRRHTTRSEITIPIFNRNTGLCGLRVPPFSTFCTGVDTPVDTPGLLPAKQRSEAPVTRKLYRRSRPKAPHFPDTNMSSPCGKTPPVWVQWRLGSDT
jgi:hypothetical protein